MTVLKVRLETAKLRKTFYEEKFLVFPEEDESSSKADQGHRLCMKASAWYVATYSKKCILDAAAAGQHKRRRAQPKPLLISFAWIPLDFLCRIKTEKLQKDQSRG